MSLTFIDSKGRPKPDQQDVWKEQNQEQAHPQPEQGPEREKDSAGEPEQPATDGTW